MYSWRVPPTLFGNFDVVAINDLGDMGPSRSEPVRVYIKPIGALNAALPWLALLGILCLKQNRRRAAWFIFIPILGILIPSLAVITFHRFFATRGDHAAFAIMSLALGTAAWWLLVGADCKNFFAWLIRSVLAFAFMGVIVLVTCYPGFAEYSTIPLIIVCGEMVVLILAGWFAGRVSSRPAVPRLMIIYGLLIPLAVAAVFLVFFVSDPSIARRLSQMMNDPTGIWSFAGYMLSIVLLLNFIIQPFMLLAWASPFWRERMRSVLRLREPKSVQAEQVLEPAIKPGKE